ncbi:hypothetical protein Ciccas_004091 [Cichlidogyrus casuarinus]|uniref:NTF2 domain-containing protein n=1 Tax=Cichlidogyrus casuarinus TaxID=1844966 RepID=A0ABD2QDF5_9PLAT
MNWGVLRIIIPICFFILVTIAQVPDQQQQQPPVQNQMNQQQVNQQVPVQQPQINQQAQQQQFQPGQTQQQQKQQVPPQQQQQQVPPQQQQFQQAPPVQQQFQQPPPPVQQQQFQQPPPAQQQQFQQPPPAQQQQFQQQPPPPPQQQFQQPPPPPQQQYQQPPVQQQQQQFQQPPVQQQQQFQQPPPPLPQQQQQFQQPPPPQKQQPPPPPSPPPPPPRQNKPPPPPIRKEQKAPKGVDIEAIRMPSSERFEFDAAPNKAYVYFTAVVNSGARDCYFYRPITDFQVFTQVIQGGNMDISLVIVDPSGKMIVNGEAKKEDDVKISVNEENRDQGYAVCLDNRKSSTGEKVIYMSIDLNINFENPSEHEKGILDAMRSYYNKTGMSLTPTAEYQQSVMDDLLDSLGSRVRKVSMLSARTRNINTADRVTMMANHQRISSWSLFQVVLMLLVALIQTAIIRSLFEGGRVSIWNSLFTPSTASSGGATFEPNNCESLKNKIACQAGQKFAGIFYRTLDANKRADLGKYLMDNVKLIWCGNEVEGKDNVLSYYQNLPYTETTIGSISAQNVKDSISGGQNLIMITISGTILYRGHIGQRTFSDLFFLIEDGPIWKVQLICSRIIGY